MSEAPKKDKVKKVIKAGGKENTKEKKEKTEKVLTPEEQAEFDAEAARKSEEFVKEMDKEL
jgi:hypothetical protein